MIYRHVSRVGVELEGGWSYERFTAISRNGAATWNHDGSVDGTADHVGEFVSRPEVPSAIFPWLDAHYPDEDDINSSCGMHVHTSFRKMRHYAQFMDEHFFEYFKRRMKAWGQRIPISRTGHGANFWNRLAGHNDFCNDMLCPERQIYHSNKNGERYTMLNFAWSRYGTIECRLFPMFKKAHIAKAAVQELLATYEDYLRDFPPRVDGVSLTIDDDGDGDGNNDDFMTNLIKVEL